VGHEVRGVGAAMSVAWDFGGFLHPFLPTKKDGPRQATLYLVNNHPKLIGKMIRIYPKFH
ncbi:MAG: hypothetical protein AAF399_18230, partial [Bacteroidota bacterium]